MSNKETLQEYNERLEGNNDILESILETVDNLPDSDEINLQDKSVEILENGVMTVSADEGYDGLNSVEVISNIPESGGGNVYSSDEMEIGTWIDGTPLYRRVITGNCGSTTNKWNQLAKFPFRQVTKISGVWGTSFPNEQYPVPYSIGTDFLTINGISNNQTICEYHNYTYPNNAVIQVIVEYVK